MTSIDRNAPVVGFANGIAGAADRRAQALRLAEERAHERVKRLAAQSSPEHTPEERIRLWEELHGLDLPRSVTHKLVRLIASDTALSVRQVHEEQRRRGSVTP